MDNKSPVQNNLTPNYNNIQNTINPNNTNNIQNTLNPVSNNSFQNSINPANNSIKNSLNNPTNSINQTQPNLISLSNRINVFEVINNCN